MESNTISPSQQLGEDIRAAKAIFEHRFGEQTLINVNAWMDFAKEAQKYMGLNSFSEVADKLEIKWQLKR